MIPDALRDLPIAPVLAEIVDHVRSAGACVIEAPPGAGKTTAVPLALLGSIDGRILMLEPRRVAARAAAQRLAALIGKAPGGAVGYRMRGDSVPGRDVEVITEGVLTRMIQAEPDLPGIGCVIFDEFHERALQSDLGLALVLEVRGALRPDLSVVVMSATLDAEPVATLIGAPVVTSSGRAYPVETRWRDRPLGPKTLVGRAYVDAAAGDVIRAATETEGGMLVFLPGQREIAQVAARITGPLSANADIMPLHGGLPFKAQRAALTPATDGRRRIVLATAIAETSLTLPDIRVVVDGGRARRSRMDPGSGMSRLVTERVSRAEADQRRGRAGRVAEGICYRLWTKGEEGALQAYPPAEIEIADLVSLALDLASWGVDAPDGLPFLTQPDAGRFAAARDVLRMLGSLDAAGRLTDLGRRLATLPVHPRLGRMLLDAGGKVSADLAALLDRRDPMRGVGTDLSLRLDALRDGPHGHQIDHNAVADIRALSARLRKLAGPGTADLGPGAALSLAYPDRIGLRRAGDAPRYALSGGNGAVMADDDVLAGQRLIVAADLDGVRREARVRLALPVSEGEIRALHADQIKNVRLCRWSSRHRRVEAREQVRLGALVLEDRIWKAAGDAEFGPALLDGVRDLGLAALNWSDAAAALRARIAWLRLRGADVPPMDDAALLATLDQWLLPWLAGTRKFDDLRALDLLPMLKAWIGAPTLELAATLAPERFIAPTGTSVRVDYSGDQPSASIRLQELFGVTSHPVLGPDRLPLVFHLLSPAGRVMQTTADLPGFWETSYKDVRRDMRGRYPKHPWPEDPKTADPTRRTKARVQKS